MSRFPKHFLSIPYLTQIVVEAFGPASSLERPSWDELWTDKGTKLGLAATKARNSGARYVMPIDSDDLINCMLAESGARSKRRRLVFGGRVYSSRWLPTRLPRGRGLPYEERVYSFDASLDVAFAR